jgi:hypothetical protein
VFCNTRKAVEGEGEIRELCVFHATEPKLARESVQEANSDYLEVGGAVDQNSCHVIGGILLGGGAEDLLGLGGPLSVLHA